MYTNISYIVLGDITSAPTAGYVSPRHEMIRGKQETPVQVPNPSGS